MKLIKPRGLLIGEKKFQLIGPKGERSKTFDIKQSSKRKQISAKSLKAVEQGIKSVWGSDHHGSKSCVLFKFAAKSHNKFIELISKNPEKNKKVLIVGPADGYESEYISTKVKNVEINTFDLVDEIKDQHKQFITPDGIFIDRNGIENYQNKDLIGNYDGITAIFSAGFHVEDNNLYRNLLKMAMMLKPKGVALIKIKGRTETKIRYNFPRLLKKLKLDKTYKIQYIEDDGEIYTSPCPDMIITRK